jgi:tetratricopeptide (TPR) repeat protein
MTESVTLAALLRAEQRARWQLGDPVRVEAFLQRHPELASDTDGVLDLIYNEVVLREKAGEMPQLAEYLERFADLTEPLRLLFEVHGALERGGVPDTCSPTSLPLSFSGDLSAGVAGVTMPGYEVLEELGRGGMGVVYKARQTSLNRVVALKMLLGGAHASALALTRFKAEAAGLAGLQHPNLIQVYEVGEHGGLLFFSMEFVEGRSLAERISGSPLPADEAARTVAVLARAMHAAHQRGVIHRDLKPANVLLTADGTPKIADFGLAKGFGGAAHTRTGEVLGTPEYMAPEQVAGKGKDAGPAADVYALGAILYDMLTGRPPFKAESTTDTLLQVLHNDPVPPSRLRARTPRDLETICLKCLEKDPGKRYASALALAEDLDRFLDRRPILARPVSLGGRMLKWARRRPAVASLVAVSVVAVSVLALFLGWHNAVEQRRRSQAREGVLDVLSKGRDAYLHGDWAAAESYADGVLSRLDEPALADLRREAENLKNDATRRRTAQQEGEQVARAERRFRHLCDEAVFHGMQALVGKPFLTGLNGEAHRRTAEAASRAALALAGFDPEAGTIRGLAPRSRGPRQDEVAACAVLLVVLAEAVAEAPEPPDSATRARAALRFVQAASRLRPPARALHLRRADYLTRLGDESAAKAARARAESLPLTDALDYFLAGDLLARRNDFAGAVRAFESAVGLQPGHFWAECYLGVCNLHLSRWDRARASLSICLLQRPDFVWAHLLRGYAHTELEAWVAADADFDRAEQLLREQSDDVARYSLHVNRGGLRLRQGKRREAAEEFRAAIRLRPDGYVPHVNLARVLQQQNKPEEAERELEQARRLNPPPSVLADFHAARAAELCLQKKYTEAVAACRAALACQPDHTRVRGILGQALLGLGRPEEAERAFDEYLAGGGRVVADVYKGRGTVRMKRGNFLGARDDFTRALEIKPNAEVQLHRGWAYFFLDAWRPALHDFDAAVRQGANGADAYIGRGLATVMLGGYRDAVADADKALRLGPTTPEMMHNLACIFAQAVGRVRKDRTERDTARLAARYRAETFKAIRRTLALVPTKERAAFWRTKVVPDTALDPIREAPEFQELVKQYAAAPGR